MIGVEDALNSFAGSLVDRIMKAIWAAAMWLLRTAFELMDSIGGFRDGSTLVDQSGRPSPAAPFFALWPTLVWLGGAAAVGLFLWQLTVTMARGGAGFWRLASGPAAYGAATAMTLGLVAALVGAAEGVTVIVLERGLAAENFRTILDHPSLGFSDNPALDSSIDATARALLLGMIALFGVMPAAGGFLLQMLFRQAVVIVLIATVPITAAGLLANTTARWFWRSLRWMLAAILMKPALALVLVVGVNMLSGPTGVGGLMAGAGVLLISLFCPFVLFRLLAFVEQGPRLAGAPRSAAPTAAGVAIGGYAESYLDQVNTARYDAASHGSSVGGPGAVGDRLGGLRPGRADPSGAAVSVANRATNTMAEAGIGNAGAPTGAPSSKPGAIGPGDSPAGVQLPVGRAPGSPRLVAGSARRPEGDPSEPRTRGQSGASRGGSPSGGGRGPADQGPRSREPAMDAVNGAVRSRSEPPSTRRRRTNRSWGPPGPTDGESR